MRFFNKIVFASTMFCAFSCFAAQPISGFYMGGFGGATLTKGKIGGGTSVAYRQQNFDKRGYNAGLQAGARIVNVRVAAEATINTKVEMGDHQVEGYNYALELYYDLPFRSALRPYLNVGAGVYNMTIKSNPGLKTKYEKILPNFGGGFTLAMTRRTNLDVGYRFVNFGKKSVPDYDGESIPVKLLQHQIYMGFRYVF